jgi:hypothetical protein
VLAEAFPDNTELPQRIGQAIGHLAQAEEFIGAEAEKAFDAVVNKNTIYTAPFLSLHPLLQYRVLLKLLMQISSKPKPPRSENILKLLSRIVNHDKAFTLHGVQGKFTKNTWVFCVEEKIAKDLKSR